jgi:hypothetical protein
MVFHELMIERPFFDFTFSQLTGSWRNENHFCSVISSAFAFQRILGSAEMGMHPQT